MPPTGARRQSVKAVAKELSDRTPGKQNRGFHQVEIESQPIFGRGTRDVSQALSEPQKVSGPGPKPTSGALALATLPEWYVYWALLKLNKKPGIDFSYRAETTYNQGLSGQTQLDFELLDGSDIAIEVQGNFYHYEQGTAKIVQDRVRQGNLANYWTIIDIDEDDALRDPLYYVSEALEGRDHSYRYRNYWVKPFGGNR